jgi:hypothetical protein
MRTKSLAICFVLCAGMASAQFNLQGIVDLHVHTNPDSAPHGYLRDRAGVPEASPASGAAGLNTL